MPTHVHRPTLRVRLSGLMAAARKHYLVTGLWVVSAWLLVAATVVDEREYVWWSIWLALVGVMVTIERACRWLVTRFTQISSLWHDDVQLPQHRHDRAALVLVRKDSDNG